MPIYEYQCSDCDHKFEQIQQISEPDPDECPTCGGGEVSRLVSQSSFKLEGGGWFDDGYESTSTTGSTTDSGDASSSSDATGDAGGGDSQAAAE